MPINALCARLVVAALLTVTTTQVAQAGFVSTQQAQAVVQRQALLSEVETKLARDNVRAAFEQLGVAPSEVNERIGALTDAELAQVNAQLDQLPTGGSLLAVVGIVFVVLIILELVGAINIFNKV